MIQLVKKLEPIAIHEVDALIYFMMESPIIKQARANSRTLDIHRMSFGSSLTRANS